MIVVTVFVVYGILLLVEAVLSYRNSASRPALIAGILSGVVVLGAALLLLSGIPIGTSVGFGAMLAMLGIFGSRYSKTKAMVPTGAMLLASIIGLGVLFTELFQ